MRRWLLTWSTAAILGLCAAMGAESLELRDGDRVLFIGDTFFEREADYGWIETRLTARFPERDVVYRNLGWAADTPMGRARASFDWHKSPEDWLARVKEQVALVKPTVAFLGYGTTAALEGRDAIAAYKEDLGKLMDAIQGASGGPVRFVVFGPAPRGTGFLTPSEIVAREEALTLANDASSEAAAARKALFVNLLSPSPAPGAMDDGVHWTDDGYRQASAVILERLGLGAPAGKDGAALDLLNAAIRKKNEHFFHRWRPSNWTYLFGFRKHEQGQNAVEIPKFEPLIAEWDGRVRALAKAGGAASAEAAEVRRLLAAETPAPTKASAPQPIPTFEVADGFEVTLWAENPQLHKPIGMNWDARGRLWVASSEVYPQIQPGQPASDSIVVLEDAGHRGRADKATVFAAGLLIPTGVLPDDQGGCYVAASSQLLHIADTDGDGRGDRRRIILSSFGTEDTHHNLHTLRWGYDGRLYMNQSIYTHTHLETAHGVARLNSAGIWRYDPAAERIEILSKGGCNPWGHHWDGYGDEFFTDGAGGKGVYHIMPGGTYFTYSDMRREGDSISPGNYPKFAGLELVQSPNFPPDWQGNMITCDFRAHRVVRFSAEETGSSFQTKEMPDLLRSTNVTFRPIDVRMGPDGALYVADWSNPIIQHGEVDFRDPRRDKEHGRIWRVAAKGRPLAPAGDLSAAKGLALDLILSDNGWRQAEGRRLAALKLGAMTPAKARQRLAAWVAGSKDPRTLLEAVWLGEAVRARDASLIERLAASPDPRMRAAAARAAANAVGDPSTPAAGRWLARLAADPHPRVRMEAVRGLAKIPAASSVAAALAVLDKPMDPTLDYAVWMTINDLSEVWIDALKTGQWDPAGREKQLEFALRAVRPEQAATVLGGQLEKHPLTRDGAGPWIEVIGEAGDPASLRRLLETALSGGLDDAATVRAYRALENAMRLRRAQPGGDLSGLAAAFAPDRPALGRLEALKLAALWRNAAWVQPAEALARNPSEAPEMVAAALECLRAIGGGEAAAALQRLADEGPASGRWRATAALASVDLARALPRITRIAGTLDDETAALEFWRAVFAVKGALRAVADALPATGLATGAAKAGMRATREGGRSDFELARRFAAAAGLAADPRAADAALIRDLAAKAAAAGDPTRGEWIFRRQELACFTCHGIGGAGGKVGPDLTSIGASAPMDYLVESVLLPSAKIKEGYHSIVLTLKDGSEASGTLARETGGEIVLRTASGAEVATPKDSVEKREQSEVSLMPSGLLDGLPEQAQLDLFSFLSRLGKPGGFDASRGGVARRWRLATTLHTEAQAGEEFWPLSRGFDDKRWLPMYSLASGTLSRRVLEEAAKRDQWTGRLAVYAVTEWETSKAGPATFDLTAGPGSELLVDGRPAGGPGLTQVDLTAGAHRVAIRMDPKRVPETLRLTSSDGSFVLN